MIDRHKSLVHILMSGLVGLTLGLFIGWWVWPVQWTEPPATQPAASAPAQSVETPAGAGAATDSSYSAVLDWLNQGLLYVAAALLLAGAVVIGYQLLRQSQGNDPSQQPFPLPFSRRRSKQAAAPKEARAKPPPLAGRLVRKRPTLSWLHRERETEDPASPDEPVFREQAVAAPRSFDPPPPSPHFQPDTEPHVETGEEYDQATNPYDEFPEPEEWGSQVSVSEESPDQSVEEEPDPIGRSQYAPPETAAPALQEDETEQIGEFRDALQDEWPADESAEDKNAAAWEDELQTDVAPLTAESAESIEDLASGDTGLRVDDWPTVSAEPPFPERVDTPEADPGGPLEGITIEEPNAAPVSPAEQQETSLEAVQAPRLDPAIADTGRSHTDQEPADQTSRQIVGQFEANYAFGVQSYDESFTINTADGELLGACGMGINESVDRAAAEMDQVRLLDIWLYDRSAVQSFSQPLVSPGVDFTGLDGLAEVGGAVTSTPLEVVPGLKCTVRSDSILLECSIKSVTFLESEQTPQPFRSLSATLVVYVLD